MAARAVSFLASLFIVALLCASAQAQSVQCAQTPSAGTSNITCANTAFVQNQFANNFPGSNVQSGNYTIAAKDCPKNGVGTVIETTALAIITLPAASGFSKCKVLVLNSNTTRGIGLSGFPTSARLLPACGAQCLMPGQSLVVEPVSGAWSISVEPQKWDGRGSTFNFDPSGSDSANDGLVSGAPFKTLANTWIYLTHYTTGVTNIQYTCATATDNENVTLDGDNGLAGRVVNLVGNVGSPSSCTLNGNSVSPTLTCIDYTTIIISGLTLQGGGGATIDCAEHSTVDFSNNVFNGCGLAGSVFLKLREISISNLEGPNTITSATNCGGGFFLAQSSSNFNLQGQTITISGTFGLGAGVPLFVGLLNASIVGQWTFSGNFTSGKQYDIEVNAALNANGSSYPAGLAAGTTSSGGQAI